MGLAATSGNRTNADGASNLGTISVLARLDAFKASAVAGLGEDGKDSFEACRQ